VLRKSNLLYKNQVTDPVPHLVLAGDTYSIDRFEIQGDNTLNFFRKGPSINMDRKIGIYNATEHFLKKYEEFKLLAMVYDYTYIENCVVTNTCDCRLLRRNRPCVQCHLPG
jgi:hypothetical protein